jgi:uncharacterized protein (TIGR03066 family)
MTSPILTAIISTAMLSSPVEHGLPKQRSISQKLVGCWHLVTSTGQDPVEMEFKVTGELFYSIESRDRWSIMKLTYKIDGNTIVSNQPSHPREERTKFHFEPDGSLVLSFNGETSRYRRGPKRAPKA